MTYTIEKYDAGFCIKNEKGEYLWFGSDDGEQASYFFSDSERRRKPDGYSDTVTVYAESLKEAKSILQHFLKQEKLDDIHLTPTETYKITIIQ